MFIKSFQDSYKNTNVFTNNLSISPFLLLKTMSKVFLAPTRSKLQPFKLQIKPNLHPIDPICKTKMTFQIVNKKESW